MATTAEAIFLKCAQLIKSPLDNHKKREKDKVGHGLYQKSYSIEIAGDHSPSL